MCGMMRNSLCEIPPLPRPPTFFFLKSNFHSVSNLFMRTLYQQQHALSNDFRSIRAKNTGEFRGAARGVRMSRIFCDLPKFSLIYYPVALDLSNLRQFAPYVQKRLDTRPRCGYNGAGNLIVFAHRFCTGADLLLLKKFCPYPQKRLDNSRFCT